MDKLRQRAKRKRRREREKAEMQTNKRLAREFNEHYKKLGMRHNFKPAQVRRAIDSIEKAAIRTAIMTDTIAVLWAMRTECGYGNRRLCRLATEIMRRANWIGTGDRSMRHLNEELKDDAKLDCSEYWNSDTEVDAIADKAERQRRRAILKTAPTMFSIPMHAVYYELFNNSLVRKSERLDKIARLASAAAEDAIINDRLGYYQAELEKCGFYINLHGRFSGRDVKREEYEKYAKMLQI